MNARVLNAATQLVVRVDTYVVVDVDVHVMQMAAGDCRAERVCEGTGTTMVVLSLGPRGVRCWEWSCNDADAGSKMDESETAVREAFGLSFDEALERWHAAPEIQINPSTTQH